MLAESTRQLEAHSQLRGAVLDFLHAAGIEIVSPNVISSRAFSQTTQFLPTPTAARDSDLAVPDDAAVFDEASAAAARESEQVTLREALRAARSRRDAVWDPAKRKQLTKDVERLEQQLAALED